MPGYERDYVWAIYPRLEENADEYFVPLRVQLDPGSKVWIDQYSGAVLAVENPLRFTAGETFFNLMWPLHNGELLGMPSRILWCLAGLVLLILYVTGYQPVAAQAPRAPILSQ